MLGVPSVSSHPKNAHEPDVLLSNQLFDWWNIYPLLQVTITQSSIDVNLHDETVL
jgi:hypothetical protein